MLSMTREYYDCVQEAELCLKEGKLPDEYLKSSMDSDIAFLKKIKVGDLGNEDEFRYFLFYSSMSPASRTMMSMETGSQYEKEEVYRYFMDYSVKGIVLNDVILETIGGTVPRIVFFALFVVMSLLLILKAGVAFVTCLICVWKAEKLSEKAFRQLRGLILIAILRLLFLLVAPGMLGVGAILTILLLAGAIAMYAYFARQADLSSEHKAYLNKHQIAKGVYILGAVFILLGMRVSGVMTYLVSTFEVAKRDAGGIGTSHSMIAGTAALFTLLGVLFLCIMLSRSITAVVVRTRK